MIAGGSLNLDALLAGKVLIAKVGGIENAEAVHSAPKKFNRHVNSRSQLGRVFWATGHASAVHAISKAVQGP